MLPTRTLERGKAESLVRTLRAAPPVTVDERVDLRSFDERLPEQAEASAFGELITSEAMREQVLGFAAAGIAFVRGRESFTEMAPTERVAVGGSSAVTRVMRSEERLLLETERLNIRFAATSSIGQREDLLQKYRLLPLQRLGFAAALIQAVSTAAPARELALELLRHDIVEHAAPDFIQFIGQRHAPGDPEYVRQWHLRNRTTAGADIHAEAAWNVTRGAAVRIAVVDNGFDAAHPDLSLAGESGWFRPTADMVTADFVPGMTGMPAGNHGTACAGMAAARSNAVGGCGVAFEADLMAVACLPDQVGTQATLARALAYAANPALEPVSGFPASSGADVIACSLGPNGAQWQMEPILQDAIDYAVSTGRDGRGTAVLWATTNGNYPISFDEVSSHPSVIAVGRSTSTDSDDGSGYGPELAFLAPGVDVHIAAQGGGYRATTGTSFACPCAAGVAALAIAVSPDLSASDVGDILRATCDKVGPLPYNNGRNDRYGHGRVNADTVVQRATISAPQPNRFPAV
ncbi:MAG: S8 family serine peptidase [Reyranellaceae bacterium]